MSSREERRAARLRVKIPTLINVIGQKDPALPAGLAAVYERVKPATERVGDRFPAVLRDLSTNGAFIAGYPLPLLSRVGFTFSLDGFGQVEVLAWSLWRRHKDCEVPQDGHPLKLEAGFGVLFEAISLDARRAIAEHVAKSP